MRQPPGGGGFAVGACDGDHVELLCWLPEIRRCDRAGRGLELRVGGNGLIAEAIPVHIGMFNQAGAGAT